MQSQLHVISLCRVEISTNRTVNQNYFRSLDEYCMCTAQFMKEIIALQDSVGTLVDSVSCLEIICTVFSVI